MNVVAWARVSSREQAEGYSLDAQLRAARQKAEREGWKIIREFMVAESAKRGADRAEFNRMLGWVKQNAKKQNIGGILSHKLDRACRNMRDAVRLQELEDSCGVSLLFVDNEFGPGAAGLLSFNVMAAVAQYYSDNLQAEVLKGMNEKVRQGWLPGHTPYGYRNVTENKEEPIQPDPEKARTVVRIFALYARGDMTFKLLADRLQREGHIYRTSQPRFHRTALSYILKNRFYVGEMLWQGKTYPGKHRPIIDRETFDVCQDLLNGKNRRVGNPTLSYAGGLFRCAYCGAAMTGEIVRRKLVDGSTRPHTYYRCTNNSPAPDHPSVRWREEDIEEAVEAELRSLKMPSQEVADWFRRALDAAFSDITGHQQRQQQLMLKRKAELKNMLDRLLNGYLAGTIEEAVFQRKSAEFKAEAERVAQSLEQVAAERDVDVEGALGLFDFTQTAAEVWHGSNSAEKREILDCVSLNRTLSTTSLDVAKRKPFDALAKTAILKDGGRYWT